MKSRGYLQHTLSFLKNRGFIRNKNIILSNCQITNLRLGGIDSINIHVAIKKLAINDTVIKDKDKTIGFLALPKLMANFAFIIYEI